MGDARMSVDEVAAQNLLLALGLEADEVRLADAVEHMRAHRVAAERFDAVKAREELLSRMETAFMERAHPQDDGWSAGYAAAEREALNWAAERGHGASPAVPQTKGAILRSLIRAAKGRAATGSDPTGGSNRPRH